MKVTFVVLGTGSLGVEALAAYLREHGHEVGLVFDPGLFDEGNFLQLRGLGRALRRPRRVARRVLEQRPDLVAFSVLTDTYRWALELARAIREQEPGLPVVFGGVHPSLVPERVLARPEVDFVVQGEGEGALLDLLEQLGRGEVEPTPNLWFRRGGRIVSRPPRPLIRDLDRLPLPDKSIYGGALRTHERYSIATARGCPFGCTFCSHNALRRLYRGQPYVRRRSPEHVLAELRRAHRRRPLRYVKFEDDIFTLHRSWLEDFLPRYAREIGAPYGCIVHPDFVDERSARLLRETGCADVEIGVQTMDERIRREFLGRRETNESVLRALDTLDRHGLRTIVDHILDLPGETDESLREAARTYARLRHLLRVSTFHLAFFPRTEIVRIGLETGLIDESDLERIEEGGLNLYFYRSDLAGRPPATLSRQAEVFFKLLPLLPHRARPLLAGRAFERLDLVPEGLLIPIMGLAGLLRRDPFLAVYLEFYADHLRALARDDLRELLGRSP